MSASISYEEAVKLFVSNHRMASDNPDSFPVVLDLSLEPAIYEGKEGIRYLVDNGNHGVQEVGWIYEADHPGKVPKQRWPFQATVEDKGIIDAINASRPFEDQTVASAIRYALTFTAGSDPKVFTAWKALMVIDSAGGHVGECIDWLNDGDGDTLSVGECITEWAEIGASYLT